MEIGVETLMSEAKLGLDSKHFLSSSLIEVDKEEYS
jgi:hypothetical protein